MWPGVSDGNGWVLWVLLIAGGYLLGSVHFCRLIPLTLKKIDIAESSRDGNPGAANVFVTCGWKMGLFCLFCDMAKGFLPVFAALKWLPWTRWPIASVMLAPALGHAFSVYWRFRGGKCIAVIFGEMIALLWHTPVGLILAGLYIFFSVAVKIQPHRRRSIVTFACFLPAALALEIFLGQGAVGIGCVCLSLLAIGKHAVMKDDGA
ncbi:MAG: glycerol-3-phosphate acyltransferase [Clostridia bacterium]|nr:glycerol-3-phosphate acyltransferase [Clostridia bacterium]